MFTLYDASSVTLEDILAGNAGEAILAEGMTPTGLTRHAKATLVREGCPTRLIAVPDGTEANAVRIYTPDIITQAMPWRSLCPNHPRCEGDPWRHPNSALCRTCAAKSPARLRAVTDRNKSRRMGAAVTGWRQKEAAA